MASDREILMWVGVALIVAGGLVGLYGLMITGYAPLAAAWWGYGFFAFWGGITAVIGGVAALLVAAYGMEEPYVERKAEEITA